jgi:HEAT repeat protein
MVDPSSELRSALERALGGDDARLRWGAAYTLAAAGALTRGLWPAVRETLALEDGDQRWAAAEITCRLVTAHPGMSDEVRGALGDDNPVLRKMALYCLRDLGVSDLSRVAYQSLPDPEPGVRLAALSALARARPEGADAATCAEAASRLVVEDPDAGVRRAAAATLGMLGVSSDVVTAALARAVASDDPSLARAAAGARDRLAKRS